MIVDIQCEDDTIQIARIIHEHGDMYAVNFLEKVKLEKYNFNKQTELVPKESVVGFYDVEKLEDTNLYFMNRDGDYELIDDSDDEDYTCSDEDETDSETESDISLEDEDDEA